MNAVVEVIPANHPPAASDRVFTINESTSIGITLVNLGSDPDGDPLSYVIVEPPQHGSLLESQLGVAYTPADGFTGTDAFSFRFVDSYGAESAPAQVTLYVQPLIPQVTAISPNSAVAGSAGFTLSIQGNASLRGAEILWNGSSRPTTCFNFGLVTAQIPASDLVSTPDLTVALVTVRNPGGGLSSPVPFTVKNASVENVDGDSVGLSAAVYSGTPPERTRAIPSPPASSIPRPLPAATNPRSDLPGSTAPLGYR